MAVAVSSPAIIVSELPGAASRLSGALAVVVRNAVSRETCERWALSVRAGRNEWVADFEGEQFCLGRAFYTHLEEEKTLAYFKGAKAADGRVEKYLPGLQAGLRGKLAAAVSGHAASRVGFCGAGVHIFPAGGFTARHGGVVHADIEGLTPAHVAARKRALSLVLMIDPPERGGGLRLWPRLSQSDRDLGGGNREDEAATLRYEAGDLAVFDSYRVHQIEPFEGDRDRISATLHACEIDDGVWECWF